MKIIWRTAMSMDGKLASVGHNLDFLQSIHDREAAAADFPAFLDSIDAILLGADTLRWLVREGHGWPHGDKPTWLVSHDDDLRARIGDTPAPLRRVQGDLRPALSAMEESGARRVWLCGGGQLAAQLLEIDRIDEVEVTIAPVALGAGPSLFGDRSLTCQPFSVLDCRTVAGNAVAIRWGRRPKQPIAERT